MNYEQDIINPLGDKLKLFDMSYLFLFYDSPFEIRLLASLVAWFSYGQV